MSLAGALLLSLSPALAPQAPARLLRFPHMQGEKIAFVYGGDIWTASAAGGEARRVTSFDEGFELFPRISPDGEWIAFSGQYTGSRQIWIVPFEGGVPRQLTFYPDVGEMPPRGGYDHLPLDWSPDGERILIRANRTPYGQRVSRYFWVDPWKGGLEQPLQLSEGGPASLSPDGSKLAYNMISREWRTWKRYRAGRAQDVWIYDLAADSVRQLTEFEGTDNFPMWLGNRIYFTSDRSGTLNLYRIDLETNEQTQVTHYDDFDVLFPSRGDGGVIFQRAGYLHIMDATTEQVRKLEIALADDRPWLRPAWKGSDDGGLASYDISPSAKRAVVEFRGELFDVPAEQGQARNLSQTPDRRERDVEWSPDGRHILFLAEVGDDYELFVRSMVDASERQVTSESGAWIEQASWSPDSASILITDKANRIRIVDVESGDVRELDHSAENTIRSSAWSADSGWVTYLKTAPNGFDNVWICAVDGEPIQVTSDHYDDGGASFDPDGDYLYFTSWRDFAFGDLDFEGRLYALLLRNDVPSPVAPQEDVEEATQPEEEEEEDAKASQAESSEPSDPEEQAAEVTEEEQPEVEPLQIDLEGLSRRLVALPGQSGSYFNLEAVPGGLLFVHEGDLRKYDLEERESKTVLEGVSGYMLTPDAEKLLYRHAGKLHLAKVAPEQKVGSDTLPTEGVLVRVAPRVEWAQIYLDAWRIMRDWFYDPDMHGVDWRAMRDKYQPLVDHVAHRADLDFILGELVGELNAGHTYVLPGEAPRVERVPVGVLGCELQVDSGVYRIAHIFEGRGWNSNERSPLAEAGVDAREGDYLLAIDGTELSVEDNPYRLLENKVGVLTRLSLAASPDAEPREVIVRPVASELRLRYIDWVENNRRIVDELSDGRIGYVHVPNTSIQGHRELWEGFSPQARVKQAMIIDDRYNGGGFIPWDMIGSIAAPVLNYWSRRGTQPSPTPARGFDGPMVMLINGYSSSGGDAFPYYFRKLGLGPLMGKRTWGGLIGYSGSPALVDGGGLAVPSFSFINTEGQWDVEAVGVAPDLEVFDDPTLIQAGREPMLEAAVGQLLEQLEREPAPQRPPTPAGPDRAR